MYVYIIRIRAHWCVGHHVTWYYTVYWIVTVGCSHCYGDLALAHLKCFHRALGSALPALVNSFCRVYLPLTRGLFAPSTVLYRYIFGILRKLIKNGCRERSTSLHSRQVAWHFFVHRETRVTLETHHHIAVVRSQSFIEVLCCFHPDQKLVEVTNIGHYIYYYIDWCVWIDYKTCFKHPLFIDYRALEYRH